MTQLPSISIDKAAELLNVNTDTLTAFCEQDTVHRYHHRTVFTNRIRFFSGDICRLKKYFDGSRTASVCTR